MDTGYIFKPGDRVRVISACQTYGLVGVVIGHKNAPWTDKKFARVHLDNDMHRVYNEKSLVYIGHVNITCNQNNQDINNKKENKNMQSINGNYRVARVNHIQNYSCQNKLYSFALFDDDVVVGDMVLCDTAQGYSLGRVETIFAQEEYFNPSRAHNLDPVTKEIVCKVDFSKFYNRVNMRRERATIKSKMDKLLQNDKELIMYQAIAEKNPEMKELLTRYIELSHV